MPGKLLRDQTRIVLIADEALESARQLTSWPCDDDAFNVRTNSNAAREMRRATIVDCLALGAVAYHPEAWLHVCSVFEKESSNECTHEIAASTRRNQPGRSVLSAVGRAVMRFWYQER